MSNDAGGEHRRTVEFVARRGRALSESQAERSCAARRSIAPTPSVLDDTDTREAPAALARLRVNTFAAPAVPVDAVHALWSQGTDSLLWDPPTGLRAAACGAAVRLTASGPQRMAHLREAAARLWRTVAHETPGEAPAPRLWGGFAFAPGAARDEAWRTFGDANFVLPRLTYWTDGRRGWLQAIGADDDEPLAEEADRAHAAITGLATGRIPVERGPAGCGASAHATIAPPDAAAWERQVNGILEAIAAGRVRKVVAALCAEVLFEQAPSVTEVLANLRRETGPVWRFAIARGGSTFLGATPELLVRRRGDRVESEALAGTLAKEAGSGEDLLASPKDRAEHAFVREGVADALSALCSELRVPEVPAVRELSRLCHLATPIQGRLAGPTHVLGLCERLHPTPATCGTPAARALEMILASEATARGWYAAPIGWFDAAGDGEFVVGLRSGLLAGRTVSVYAGAGIVAGSHPDRELAEVRLKQRVLLNALGLAGASG